MEHHLVDDVSPLQKHLHLGRDTPELQRMQHQRSSAPLIMEHLLVDDVSPLQKHLHLGRDYRRMDRLG